MMRAEAAAARGQTCAVAGAERGRQRTEAEQQDQRNGERAPHLLFMVHEERDRQQAER